MGLAGPAYWNANEGLESSQMKALQTFDAFAVGETIFVPSVTQKEIPTQCPDCLGEKLWTITMPSGASRTIDCPRCEGGKRHWLLPTRHERTLEIKEAKVSEVTIRVRKAHKSEETHTGIDYRTEPYIGHVSHDRVHASREVALAAGERMLAADATKDEERWQEELKKVETRSGQDIITALQAEANAAKHALERKVDKLKEQMMEAIRYPTLYGPKFKTRSYGSPEITEQAMADWLGNMLSEADIEGWSEQELHEAMCSCA